MKEGLGSYSEPGSELAQMTMYLHRKTAKAGLFSDDQIIENAKWLPFSQITMTEGKKPRFFIVTMPEWLAKKNDLI